MKKKTLFDKKKGVLMDRFSFLMDRFSFLPIELMLDIFVRLPSESVLDCKLVCKTWRNLIQHPSFSRMHLDGLNQSVDPSKLSFFSIANFERCYYFEYDDNVETPINKIVRVNYLSEYVSNNYVGSVNGLICCTSRNQESRFTITNPMTKEYVILPDQRINKCDHYWSGGFGYLSSTNEYKVLAICENRVYVNKESDYLYVMIYTLGCRKGWRNVGKLYIELQDYGEPGVFLNGTLNFLNTKSGMIVVFDLADEKFREQIQLPTSPADSTLGVLGEFLSYCKYKLGDTWLYKNATIEQEEQYHGWTKESNLHDRRVLGFTKSGRVLSYNLKCVNIYDPKTSTSKRLVDIILMNDIIKNKSCEIFHHKNTLVSLKELGEKEAKIMDPLLHYKHIGNDEWGDKELQLAIESRKRVGRKRVGRKRVAIS